MIVKKKIWPEYFEAVASGKKKFELRLNDFEVNEGDTLVLEEWDPKTKAYTGRKIEKQTGTILRFKPSELPFWPAEEIDKHGLQIISLEDPPDAILPLNEFKKLDLRVAKIISAERVEGSDKLVKLTVNLGTEERQIIAGIGKAYEPSSLTGKQIVIVANLESKKLMGLESQGMLLAASSEGVPVLLIPDQEVPAGSMVR